MRSILLLATVATAKPLFEDALPEVRTKATPAPDYWSGYWHHDRCGRRLKAFLFLHDILPDGRPTMVANASHRTHYFTYDWLKGSRFADKYIRENYDVVPMTGKRGGGFIFDTNAIHKGTAVRENQPALRGGAAPRQFDFRTGEMSGVRSRTVLLVEFMETHKVSPLWHVGLGGPCGSARKNKVPTRADLCYGVVDREIVATKCA